MTESEVKKCPKFGGKMVSGDVRAYWGVFSIHGSGRFGWGNRIHALYCKNCGCIELYKEKKK